MLVEQFSLLSRGAVSDVMLWLDEFERVLVDLGKSSCLQFVKLDPCCIQLRLMCMITTGSGSIDREERIGCYFWTLRLVSTSHQGYDETVELK